MWKERIVYLVIALVVSGGAYYMGRQQGIGVGQANVQQAARQFNAQRGTGGGFGGRNGGNGAQGQNVFGTVDSISGSTLTVKTRTGTTAKVELADGGTVRKQVDGTLADIKPGDTIVASGAMSGDVLQATTIQDGVLGGAGRALQ